MTFHWFQNAIFIQLPKLNFEYNLLDPGHKLVTSKIEMLK